MKGFYNGFFALGVISGVGACIVSLILLEWFGFRVSASSGFLAALLGAVVGGSFTIAAQMMATDAAAKEAKNERDEQGLKIEKAISRSIFLKIHDFQNETILMGQHYTNRTEQNSLITNGNCTLALEFPYDLHALKFSIEEKSMCLEWENHDLINGLNDLESLARTLEFLHDGYSEKIVAFLGAMKPTARGHMAEAFSEGKPEDNVKFQQLLRILGHASNQFSKAKILLQDVKAMIESELSARFGATIKYK